MPEGVKRFEEQHKPLSLLLPQSLKAAQPPRPMALLRAGPGRAQLGWALGFRHGSPVEGNEARAGLRFGAAGPAVGPGELHTP